MSKTICPLTKLPVIEKPEWQNIDISSNLKDAMSNKDSAIIDVQT